ncbi:TMS membrane protein/tumour differentially expressed protein [Ostreococcus tauri]|jgi:serine incorporator 1/3|uniref:Serine incorporator/TMS membrane protein n=1 Tax=Ostreococcus tauri TaxID=70448 RepID=A0A090N4P5_OSTTA|nr:TMS membrane protein/tumour differentially expressed protein [Ostreococcus tauri]OUS42137.1 serine incorporator/TMS membrane protein [Ostreococcus tauri]CEG01070.1 TMS membrane protein/tumour differentially expressed protein [Ostreococcus tauri]|eukprot:XP_003075128.2 TMS membrane protein/tumour differentially expressed protein [Ostreococcus tauri]
MSLLLSCVTTPLMSCLGSCVGTCVGGALTPKNPPARATHALFFSFATALAWFVRDVGAHALERYAWAIPNDHGYTNAWFRTQAVYRASCATFVLFATLSASLVGTRDKGDARDRMIHRGSWGVKMLAYVILNALTFCLASDGFMDVYAGAARLGSGLFLVIQMIIVLDFSFAWNESWASGEHWGWIAGLIASTLAMFGASIGLFVEMYRAYAPSRECHRNVAMITSTAVLCAVLTLITFHPISREGCLLPTSAVTLYCAYLCYSALSSEPSTYACRPQSFIDANEALRKPATLVQTVFTLVSVVYAAMRAGESNFWHMDVDEEFIGELGDVLNDEEDEEAEDESSPSGPVRYNYSFFHLIFALAAMYTSMLLTGWGTRRPDDSEAIGSGWASVWVKYFSVWATGTIYAWCLVAPALFPEREF